MTSLRLAVLIGLILLASTTLEERQAGACTRALYVSPDHKYMLVGRNMDWPGDMRTNLWVLPRGAVGNGMGAANSLQWKAKYGSIAATAYNILAADGMNEKGLVGGLQWLTSTDYGKRDTTRPGLSVSMWLQFCLDNFATVDEAVQFFHAQNVQIIPAISPYEVQAPLMLHLALSDKTGDSAILEYIDGKLVIYRGKEANIMTNEPPMDQQLAYLKKFQAFGGVLPLPGDTTPENRFVRTTFYIDQMPEPKSERQAIASMLSIMRNASQPFEKLQKGNPFTAATVWRTVADLATDTYYFESTMSPNVVWVDLKQIDFDYAQSLDLANFPDRAGNVSADFQRTPLFAPLEPSAQ